VPCEESVPRHDEYYCTCQHGACTMHTPK